MNAQNLDNVPGDSDGLKTGMVAVLGVPFDANSSFMRGAAGGPGAIRAALHSDSANLCAEGGLDLGSDARWRDLGDVQIADSADVFGGVETVIASLLDRGIRVLALGGDHSISIPVLRAYARAHAGLSILHLDAHPDLYDEYDGNRLSHACPFARVMEEGLAKRLVQIGVRTMNPHQSAQAERFGVEVVPASEWTPELDLKLEGPIYLSLDMDCFDPAFAPGVSHREPGGLSSRDVLRIIAAVEPAIVGADIVELNPSQDPLGITAMLGAKLVKELLGRMVE